MHITQKNFIVSGAASGLGAATATGLGAVGSGGVEPRCECLGILDRCLESASRSKHVAR